MIFYLQERLAKMEEEVNKAEVQDKMMTEQKKREIEEAERMKNEPVSDVKLVSHFIYRQIGHYPFDVCRWWSLYHWTDHDPQKY